MQHVFITGSSRGLGKALTELFLQQTDTTVTGIARKCTIEHANYTHITLDLANVSAVKAFNFEVPANASRIIFINNAGRLGEIKRFGTITDDDVIETYNVNLVSPTILCNHFIAAFSEVEAEKIIVNVSSGAGKNAIDAWGTYCATKAGLDILSETINLEQIGVQHPIKVLAVAPGIVDTEMQSEIRAANPTDFSRHAEFIEFKNSGLLAQPELIAAKYLYILNNLTQFEETLYSVRDLD